MSIIYSSPNYYPTNVYGAVNVGYPQATVVNTGYGTAAVVNSGCGGAIVNSTPVVNSGCGGAIVNSTPIVNSGCGGAVVNTAAVNSGYTVAAPATVYGATIPTCPTTPAVSMGVVNQTYQNIHHNHTQVNHRVHHHHIRQVNVDHHQYYCH